MSLPSLRLIISARVWTAHFIPCTAPLLQRSGIQGSLCSSLISHQLQSLLLFSMKSLWTRPWIGEGFEQHTFWAQKIARISAHPSKSSLDALILIRSPVATCVMTLTLRTYECELMLIYIDKKLCICDWGEEIALGWPWIQLQDGLVVRWISEYRGSRRYVA